jgi:hypothetical protein
MTGPVCNGLEYGIHECLRAGGLLIVITDAKPAAEVEMFNRESSFGELVDECEEAIHGLYKGG